VTDFNLAFSVRCKHLILTMCMINYSAVTSDNIIYKTSRRLLSLTFEIPIINIELPLVSKRQKYREVNADARIYI